MRRVLTSQWLWWAVCFVLFLLVTAMCVLNVTPTPGALLTRRVFDDGAASMRERNAQFADPNVTVKRDISYVPDGSPLAGKDPGDTELDVYLARQPLTTHPRSPVPMPTVVWIHGGGWVSGDKGDPGHYLTRLAGAGFTVVSLNYSLAPERRYPLAIAQLNEALRFVVDHAGEYTIDPTRLVLAGDSAGANLASQLAAMITNPGFAHEVGVTRAIGPERLRGALLNCGVYDAYALRPTDHPNSTPARILGWGVNNTLWAYTGSRQSPSAALDQMSTIRHVTAQFPPTWIGAGNADALTAKQSVPLAAALRVRGVDVATLIYDDATPEQLGHEFQFELGTPAGQRALAESIEFVRRVTG
ncbi:alpha/beta hydrolase [Gordonia araii]|uniref:alpha/beta hydrolase n=1 Tax=Gordonia araii TaxID=263909 RepID=UPI000590C625|nr:alpha/beta hydrolase [Gordonia araii]NNG96065.1 alpha/beta hydrolase [Gordonia araii NBRC 100433]